MKRLTGCCVVLSLLVACATPGGEPLPPPAVRIRDAPSETASRAPDDVAARLSPRSEDARSPGRAGSEHVSLPRLPARGLAVPHRNGVRLLDMQGRVLTFLPNFDLHWEWTPGRAVRLSRGRSQFVLEVARHRLRRATARDARAYEAAIDRGFSYAAPESRGRAVSGHWRWVIPSPDGTATLGQWSGECEVPTAYRGGDAEMSDPRPAVAGAPMSVALGWTVANEPVLHLPEGECGTSHDAPGIYAANGHSLRRLAQAQGEAQMWFPSTLSE